jgi:hypothetical protein
MTQRIFHVQYSHHLAEVNEHLAQAGGRVVSVTPDRDSYLVVVEDGPTTSPSPEALAAELWDAYAAEEPALDETWDTLVRDAEKACPDEWAADQRAGFLAAARRAIALLRGPA